MRRSADEIGATLISFRPKVFSDPASVVDGIFSAHRVCTTRINRAHGSLERAHARPLAKRYNSGERFVSTALVITTIALMLLALMLLGPVAHAKSVGANESPSNNSQTIGIERLAS